MKKILQIAGLTVALILTLSITFNNKPLFTHIYDLISPATKYVQTKTENFLERSFSTTESYSKKIFANSVPRVKDSVKSKVAAPNRIQGEPEEKITIEDKQELDQLIKNH